MEFFFNKMLISSNWLQKKKDITAKLFTSKPVYIIRFIDQISFLQIKWIYMYQQLKFMYLKGFSPYQNSTEVNLGKVISHDIWCMDFHRPCLMEARLEIFSKQVNRQMRIRLSYSTEQMCFEWKELCQVFYLKDRSGQRKKAFGLSW